MYKSFCIVLGIIAGILPAQRLAAETAYGLSTPIGGVQGLFRFDTDNLGTISGGAITGTGGELLADIDFYPVNGELYGIGATTGTLYQIDPATQVATIDVANAAVGTPTDIDFNPVADRLRVFSSGDANYRLTPAEFDNAGLVAGQVTVDGTLSFAAADANAGANPNLVGNAYTNSVNGALSTQLFSVDADLDALILHSGPPAFSTLNTVADLTLGGNSFDLEELAGFDISPTSGIAYLSNGNDLYTVNLATGQLTGLGQIFGFPIDFQSIAIGSAVAVPEPASIGLAVLSAAVFGMVALSRRWRRVAA